MVLLPVQTIELKAPNHQPVLSISKQTVQRLFLAHLRVTRAADVQADLLIVDGEDPNAFAGPVNQRRAIAINTAMLRLLGDDIDASAALLGHETAHWAKGHVERGAARSSTIQGLGMIVGMGLGAVGVPGAGYIAGLGADIIETSYSREDEREADASGLEYMISGGFDPQGAVRLHEKLLGSAHGLRIPFLSTHPSGSERIDHLKRLIEEKQALRGPDS
jgi:predicted Zn-dependent protease